jgi:carbon storage regulator
MLVLSRKRGQRIVIGDNVEVTIIEIRGDRVKLGFIGPNHVPIHREELLRRMEPWRNAEEIPAGRALAAARMP